MSKENNRNRIKRRPKMKEYNKKTGPKNKHRTKATSNDLLKLQKHFASNRL